MIFQYFCKIFDPRSKGPPLKILKRASFFIIYDYQGPVFITRVVTNNICVSIT